MNWCNMINFDRYKLQNECCTITNDDLMETHINEKKYKREQVTP